MKLINAGRVLRETTICGVMVLASCAAHPTAAADASQTAPAAGDRSSAIIGAWKALGRPLVVRVERGDNGTFTGTVTEAGDSRIVGQTAFRDLTYDAGSDEWRGQALAPRQGAYLPARIRIPEPKILALTVGADGSTKTILWDRQ